MTHDASGHSDRPDRRVHRMGSSALLVDCRELDDVLALHAALTDDPLPDQVELIPAATTLLVRFARTLPLEAARSAARRLASAEGLDGTADAVAEVRIPVVYDGEDLAVVADLLGCSAEDVVARHTSARWTAAFGGFSPGFAYLVQQGASPETSLTVPRRSSPRTRVPAGSVALAGDFSAVYPSDSPGGWQMIGRTDAPVWDLGQNPPALIVPGAPVQFEAVREDAGTVRGGTASSDTSAATENTVDDSPNEARPALRIDAPGLSTLVQDAGRPGHADWGVSPSGWADARAAHAANRLVGNDPDAAALENTAGGLALTALEDLVLAATGARTALTVSRTPHPASSTPGEDDVVPLAETHRAPQNRPFALRAGQKLTLGPATAGLRAYLAVRGGIAVDPVLGSQSADTLSRLGSEPLARGTELAVGPAPREAVHPLGEPVALPGDPGTSGTAETSGPADEAVTEIRAVRGPRTDWFTEDSLAALHETVWRVAEQSNRVGVRLELADLPDTASADAASSSDAGAEPVSPLVRTEAAQGRELPSEGLAPGAIQVPPNGMPIVFLADHPVTGGYPVAGVVVPESLRLLAQAAPGTRVRLALDTTDTLKES